jgi:3-hydroxy-9,10-secoandrosta-1,3,5(10)-triene-9,17-dione monooxygenase reductase component
MSGKLDSRPFREALGTFTTGVTIVTTIDRRGRDIGLTANSFNSVSLDPPLVLWSLARTSKSLAAFETAEYFAIHVLADDQEPLSTLFATRGADKFAGLDLARGRGGVPLLPGCAARFECRTAYRYEGGDHVIFVGEVLGFTDQKRPPLVFHGGAYAVTVPKPSRDGTAPDDLEPVGSFGRDYLGFLLSVAHHQLRRVLGEALAAHGLSSQAYALLVTLLVRDHRDHEEVEALMRYSDVEDLDALTSEMRERGLVTVQENGLSVTHSLTGAGRRLIIELVAVAKAAESDAESGLTFSESQMLKRLLRRVIRATEPGAHKLWGNRRAGGLGTRET